ncbi:MAG: AbrB/MazE/SpoVT family DNA-binding domain-containing protein [Oscillospiraceae bacterium]|nr:AbrB/MazE/SpoVT family DNA-binding domain-containing protein [Oscillospiraceae bacterium]
METTAKVSAWGGSVGIRIPKNIMKQIGISDKSVVSLKVLDSNELLIAPVKQKKTLEELFEGWDGQSYELTDEDRAWLNMEPVGRERFWEEE